MHGEDDDYDAGKGGEHRADFAGDGHCEEDAEYIEGKEGDDGFADGEVDDLAEVEHDAPEGVGADAREA